MKGIFRSGNSQAVRIPKEFQWAGKGVEVERQGDALLLRSRKRFWDTLTKSLTKFTRDYMKSACLQPRPHSTKPTGGSFGRG